MFQNDQKPNQCIEVLRRSMVPLEKKKIQILQINTLFNIQLGSQTEYCCRPEIVIPDNFYNIVLNSNIKVTDKHKIREFFSCCYRVLYDNVRFVQDQHAQWISNSVSLPKQLSVGRHVTAHGHIIIVSRHQFLLLLLKNAY